MRLTPSSGGAFLGVAGVLAIVSLWLGPSTLLLVTILLLAAGLVRNLPLAFLAFACFLPALGEIEADSYLPNVRLVFYAILAAAWIYTAVARPRKIYLDPAITCAYAAFLVVCLLSEIGSYDLSALEDPLGPVNKYRAIWEPLLITSLVIPAMSAFESRAQLRRILWTVVLSGLLYVPTLFFWGLESEAGGRRHGLFNNNALAANYTLFCAICALSLLRSVSARGRIVLWAAAGILMASQVFTVSKTVMLTVVLLVLLSALIEGGPRRMGLAALVLVLVASTGFLVAPERIRTPVLQTVTSLLLDSQTSVSGGISTFASRVWSVKTGLLAASERPLLGLGWGKHMFWITSYVDVRPNSAGPVEEFHVEYIVVLVEVGIVGLLIYLTIIGLTLRTHVRMLRFFRDQGDAAMFSITQGLLMSLATYLISFMTAPGRLTGNSVFWVLVGLTAALSRLAAPDQDCGGRGVARQSLGSGASVPPKMTGNLPTGSAEPA